MWPIPRWKRNLCISLGLGVMFGTAGLVLGWPTWLSVAVGCTCGWAVMADEVSQ